MGDGIDGSRRGRRGRGGPDGGRGRNGASRQPPRLRATPDPRMSRSLEYGLAMLECFTSQQGCAGVVDLAAALALGRSTAHRYASTLHALGYLEQDENRKYRLSTRALEPAIAALGMVRAYARAGGILADLREHVGHTVGLGALDGTRAVYVHRLHAHRSGQHAADLDLRAGASVPLHCTALGKALIASLADRERCGLIGELDLTRQGPRGPRRIASRRALTAEVEKIRAHGLSLSDEEQAPGVRSLAVSAQPPGAPWPMAIDVTVPASDWTMGQLGRELGPPLSEAAARISSAHPGAHTV
jgi:IclR family transcriptional regulator, pca regulon regulatory protein